MLPDGAGFTKSARYTVYDQTNPAGCFEVVCYPDILAFLRCILPFYPIHDTLFPILDSRFRSEDGEDEGDALRILTSKDLLIHYCQS